MLFKGDVSIDTLKVEERLRKGNLDIIVSKFDHVEEFLILHGLPPKENIEGLRSNIADVIAPFVKKVLEVAPCVYKGEIQDDFFAGKFDGNWRLKVIPRKDAYITNFIVIGSDVQAKAVYTKRIGENEEMCTDCYKTGYFRKDCPGSRSWLEYFKEFKDNWEYLLAERGDDEGSEEQIDDEMRSIVAKLRKSEQEKKDLERKNEKEKAN